MKTHTIIDIFARKYGLKEGLLLTELCRRLHASGERIIPFSVTTAQTHLSFLTPKQIRYSLNKLISSGAIIKAEDNKQSFDRTAYYSIHKTVYQYFLQTMMAQQNAKIELSMSGAGEVCGA